MQLQYGLGYRPSFVSLHVEYKPEAGEAGELVVKDCDLLGGVVEYPVVVDGPSSTISLKPGSNIWSDVVIGPPDKLSAEMNGANSTYGGLFLAIANQITTNITMQFGGGIGWEFWGAQSQASISYARNVSGGLGPSIYFADPTADFLENIRQLMFRTAIMSANETNAQTVVSEASGLHNTYHTNYTFAILATAASVTAILAVLATFHGFWHIGRKVSMSPVELAKAFNAPLMRNADSNAPVRKLLKQVGTKPVQYGIMRAGPGGRKAVPHRRSSSGNVLAPYGPYHDDFTNSIDATSASTIDSHVQHKHSPLISSPRNYWNSTSANGSIVIWSCSVRQKRGMRPALKRGWSWLIRVRSHHCIKGLYLAADLDDNVDTR